MEKYLLLVLCAAMMVNCRLNEVQKNSWRRCMPGERWTEDCHACHCDSNGFIQYKEMKDCILPDCHYRSSWYTDKERCYCSSSKGGIMCMPLQYQPGLNGRRCPTEDAEIYSDCTYCKCVNGITHCREIPCHTLLGVCTPGESRVQFCHKCTCTKTMFHQCVPLENCMQEKPGECPVLKFVNVHNYIWCYLHLIHICQFDNECPGKKKCCLINSCYYACIDPAKK